MPIYEYECAACGHRFERLQKVTDNKVRTCPECGEKKVERLFSAPAIQFKGEGWYITDYSDKGKAAKKAEKAEKGEADTGAKKGDKKEGGKKSEGGSDGGKRAEGSKTSGGGKKPKGSDS